MIAIMLTSLIEQLEAIPGGKEKIVEMDAFLFRQGEVVNSLFLVMSGEIQLVRIQPDGGSIILQRANAGEIVAEASIFSSHYHCHAIVRQTAGLYTLPITSMVKHLQDDPDFSRNLMIHLAKEVQKARFRSELLSIKTVAARLDAWLNWHGGTLPKKGEWKTLAEQLGVSPEALYREIGKRTQ